MLIPVAAGHDDQQQNNGSTDNKYRDLPKERDGSDELVEENPWLIQNTYMFVESNPFNVY